jgi:hypothetical protein
MLFNNLRIVVELDEYLVDVELVVATFVVVELIVEIHMMMLVIVVELGFVLVDLVVEEVGIVVVEVGLVVVEVGLVVEIHRMKLVGLVVVIEIVVEIHRMRLVDLVELVVGEMKIVVNHMMI